MMAETFKKHKRHSGYAYRNAAKKRKDKRLIKILRRTYNLQTGRIGFDWIDGELVPVGKYIKCPKNSNLQRLIKHYTNKRLHGYEMPEKGNAYRRVVDYQWIMF